MAVDAPATRSIASGSVKVGTKGSSLMVENPRVNDPAAFPNASISWVWPSGSVKMTLKFSVSSLTSSP